MKDQQSRIRVPNAPSQVEARDNVRRRAKKRILCMGVAFGLLLSAIGARGVQLCISPDERTISAGATQRWEQMTIRAKRGRILDRNGRHLAVSVDTPNIVVDPSLVEESDLESTAAQVASILEQPANEILQMLNRDSRYAKLASRVHPRVARKVELLDNRALFSESDSRRYYPEKNLASHLLGFVDAKGDGQMGIERSMDEYLRGSSVLLQRRRDRHGLDVDRFRDIDRSSNAGMDVHTTIDRKIQHITERALAGAVERHEPKATMAVVVDVKTGDILALANTPLYNPNLLNVDSNSRRNRVVQDAIEAGSVFKPFTVAAAIEEGLIQSETPIDCENGAWYVRRTRIRDDHPHGVISVSEVIKYSSNIGSAKIALNVGAPTFLAYMRDFGFGSRTGIPLPGERKGKIRSAKNIKPIELATTAYGQGVTSTTIQLAMATATLANGGLRMQPRLVTQVVDEHGVPAFVQNPTPVMRVLSEETARDVTEMMVTVTEPGGTARRAQIPGHRVAGKTGTAEKVVNGKYTEARIGSFMGFVPADDPKLAIVVVVDEPQVGSRYGGIVAAPVFAEIGAAALRHLGVAPTVEDELDREAPETPLSVDVPAERLALSYQAQGWSMPDLRGRSMRETLTAMQGLGLALHVQGSGHLVAQRPAPGTPITDDSLVELSFQ